MKSSTCARRTRTFRRISIESPLIAVTVLSVAFSNPAASAQQNKEACARPKIGSVVAEPEDVRSKNGLLEITLTAHNAVQPDGTRYCFVDDRGHESPNLRVNPGDRVSIHLKNAMTEMPQTAAAAQHAHSQVAGGECVGGAMTLVSTNLHFHGLTIPPTCHQDDVLKTSLEPGDTFDYRFRIPEDEAPGLYWYHPHIHGFGKPQLLGGASGALIVEGIERAKKEVAGLPERVLIIRDQDLVNPNSPPSKSEPVVPKFMIDKDGDSANNGTGFGKPAKDLSLNYVPAPYPDYPPATIQIKPGERQLWRLLNASAITYLSIQMLFGHTPQQLGLIAMDGVPIGLGTGNQHAFDAVQWQTHLGVPPGSRVEFIVQAPAAGQDALLVTRTVDTGPGGENDTNRALAKIVASADAAEPISRLQSAPQPLAAPAEKWLGAVAPVRVRHLYFSEKLADPNDPASAVEFYLTEEGKPPKMFEMNAPPDLVAQQGTVEDWIIENRSAELHAFHIHQLHFLLLEYMGRQVNENFLRDTVNVPYYSGRLLTYPSIRVRLDFRDPNTVGIFPYHCHLLEHEDKGMMGTILVEPAEVGQRMSAEGQHNSLPESSRTAQ